MTFLTYLNRKNLYYDGCYVRWWYGKQVRFDAIPEGMFRKDPSMLPADATRMKNNSSKN
jgi:hypothetical protein